MNLIEHSFLAGIPRTFFMTGRYLRLLSGTGDFKIEVRHLGGGSLSSMLIAGIGVDLSNPDTQQPYIEVDITSAVDQTIKILSSVFPSSDSRLTGDIDVNGLLSVVNAGGASRELAVVNVLAATATKVLAADLNRLKSALYFSGDCYLGKDNAVTAATGYPISGGSDWIDESTAELWVYSVGAISVRILSDLK